jgi:tRNA pseudouridine32 synthase/23S rRNA pseudouridine746 synthase
LRTPGRIPNREAGSKRAGNEFRQPTPSPQDRLVFKGVFGGGEPGTASDFLASRTGLSRRSIKEVMAKGGVWLRRGGPQLGPLRRLRRSTATLRPGDRLELYYDRPLLAREPPQASLIEGNPHYSVWYKPAGLLSCGTQFGDHCSLLRQAQRWRGPRGEVFPVHRLDREVSGLMLVAHTREAAARLSRLFAKARVIKRYCAEVRGDIRASLGEEGRIARALDGKEAVTLFRVRSYDPGNHSTTLEVHTETGRLHQIRRHLAAVGHPILGDPRYGKDNKNRAGLWLSATGLRFLCPFRGTWVSFDVDSQGADAQAQSAGRTPADPPFPGVL